MTAFPQHNASADEWSDWRWQMRHRVRDIATLERYIQPTEGERHAIKATRGIFRWTIVGFGDRTGIGFNRPIQAFVQRSCPLSVWVIWTSGDGVLEGF